ncbi:MAG: hypothetical protein CVV27_02030 [Candidatus Melainabacteria bacterium HGW-Melainabacteria-1]|nr:MAG: hypothetical protein CVV27_02030 [Candidatus Melainabacteria bacterium HGW-Melainabacteria-1]
MLDYQLSPRQIAWLNTGRQLLSAPLFLLLLLLALGLHQWLLSSPLFGQLPDSAQAWQHFFVLILPPLLLLGLLYLLAAGLLLWRQRAMLQQAEPVSYRLQADESGLSVAESGQAPRGLEPIHCGRLGKMLYLIPSAAAPVWIPGQAFADRAQRHRFYQELCRRCPTAAGDLSPAGARLQGLLTLSLGLLLVGLDYSFGHQLWFLTLIVFLVALFRLLSAGRPPRRRALAWQRAVIWLLVAVVSLGTLRLRNELTFIRARQIVAAVDAFARQHQRYPRDLAELVPTYLPSVPDRQQAGHFDYKAEKPSLRFSTLPPIGTHVYRFETGHWGVVSAFK